MFIEDISNIDSVCRFQYSRVFRDLSEEDVSIYQYIDSYLKSYCEFNNLKIQDVLKIKHKFMQRYMCDLDNFERLGKYPYEIPDNKFALTRVEYDVVLILSFLLEKHRFNIITWLASQKYEGNLLLVGVGPGVELGIIKEYLECNVILTGYDLDVNNYVLERFCGIVKKKYFQHGVARFDTVLLIEVLEHLEEPDILLKDVIFSLNKNGQVLLTTAIDIPQFDHLYNFKSGEVINMLNNFGMVCNEIRAVEHMRNTGSTISKNEIIIALKGNE